MSDPNLQALREIAEKATPVDPKFLSNFHSTFNPPTVLALLDMIKRDEDVLDELAINPLLDEIDRLKRQNEQEQEWRREALRDRQDVMDHSATLRSRIEELEKELQQEIDRRLWSRQ